MSDQGPYPGAPGPYGPGGNNPYGQPNPGQPYPGQSYPGQSYPPPVPYGAVPQYGGSPYGNYQQPPPRKKRTLWVILAVVAAVLVAGVIAVVAFAFVLGDDIDDVEAADCITLSGANSDADFDIVDCGTTSPLNFIVAETLDSSSDSCGGEQYSELTQTGANETKLCLVPNFQEGKCYEVPIASLTGMKEVPCVAASSQINTVLKVLVRVESTTVPDCPSAVTFDRPSPLGFCFGSPTD